MIGKSIATVIALGASMATCAATAAGGHLGDLDGDGWDDILMRHADGAWQLYAIDGGRPVPVEFAGLDFAANPDWRFAGLGDLDGDGRHDVVLRHADGRWRYHPADGRRAMSLEQGEFGVTANTDWRLAAIGDLNADGKDDLLLRHAHTGNWYYYPMDDGAHLPAERGMADLPRDIDWRLAGLGDLNGDGRDDLLLRHAVTGSWHYSPMDGTRYLAAQGGGVDLPQGLDWQLAGMGDFDADGKADILLRHSVGHWHYSPTLDGRQRYDTPGIADLPGNPDWRVAGIGDLDGDGRDDILLRRPDGGWEYRAMNGTLAVEASAADVAADGQWRLAAGTEPADPSRFIHSACTTATAPGVPTISSMTTRYSLVEIDHLATSYADLVTRNTSVSVPVSWTKSSGADGDNVQYLLDNKVAASGTLTAGTTSGSTTLTVTRGGKYDLQVALCKSSCCTKSAAVNLVVADTDGSHVNAITLTDGENNTAYANTSNSVVGAYFVEWGVYGRAFPVDKVPAYNLTHILYGFIPMCGGAGINDSVKSIQNSFETLQNSCEGTEDHEVALHDIWGAVNKKQAGHGDNTVYRGNFGQLMELKRAYPTLKILPSIGGWTLSDPFYYLGNATLRTRFVDSVKEFLLTWKFFDGVDIDWEYPGGGAANPTLGDPAVDGTTYRLLMQELRTMLDTLEVDTGRDLELTTAIAAGEEKIGRVNYTVSQQYLDYIFVMTYDFYGAWSTQVLGHQAGLFAPTWRATDNYNAHTAIRTLVKRQSVTPSKIILGVAMYGRGWTGVTGWTGTDHLTGTATGAVDGTWESGVLDYRAIANNIAAGTWTRHYDTAAQAPYIYKADAGDPNTVDLVSYDDETSVLAKGAYARTKGLGGLFAWEIDADNGDILNAMHKGLGHGATVANRAPLARAGPDFSVESAASVTLDATASYDLDGDALTYSWSQTVGTTVTLDDTTKDCPTFTAPTVTANTSLTFRVTVSDGTLSSSDTVVVNVLPPAPNNPPSAYAGPDQRVRPPATITLDGTGSSDSDADDTLTYSWSQLSGTTVTLTNANTATATFSATAVTTSTELRFQLTVSDGSASDTDEVAITLLGPNSAPTVSVAATATVVEGASLTIAATASDPDGDTLTYSWSTGNIAATGTSTSAITFTGPPVGANTDVTMTVTVSDGALSASASVTVTITNIPTAPVAHAGVDQRVETATTATTVTLSGTGSSDVDGDTLTYTWSQVSGTTVTLTATNTVSTSFSATAVTSPTDLTFQLTVSDGALSDTDQVVITLLQSSGANCTQVDSTAGSYAAWDADKSHYEGGDQVNHRGLIWQAYYWTTEEPIITTQDWPEKWGLLSAVDLPWHAERIYGGTEVGQTTKEVNHRGRRYRAGWWVQGEEPPGSTGVWSDIGASTCP